MSQLAAGVELAADDPDSDAAPDAKDLQDVFEALAAQAATTATEREADLAREIDSVQGRLAEVTRHFRALYRGYRAVRYQVEDAAARGDSGALPLTIVREDALLGGRSANDILAGEEVWGGVGGC